jgi:hypothetical protein
VGPRGEDGGDAPDPAAGQTGTGEPPPRWPRLGYGRRCRRRRIATTPTPSSYPRARLWHGNIDHALVPPDANPVAWTPRRSYRFFVQIPDRMVRKVCKRPDTQDLLRIWRSRIRAGRCAGGKDLFLFWESAFRPAGSEATPRRPTPQPSIDSVPAWMSRITSGPGRSFPVTAMPIIALVSARASDVGSRSAGISPRSRARSRRPLRGCSRS